MACTHAPAELLLIIILGEVAIGWEYVVCDLCEVFCLRDFSQSPPMMVVLTTKASSPTTSHFDTTLVFFVNLVLGLLAGFRLL